MLQAYSQLIVIIIIITIAQVIKVITRVVLQGLYLDGNVLTMMKGIELEQRQQKKKLDTKVTINISPIQSVLSLK